MASEVVEALRLASLKLKPSELCYVANPAVPDAAANGGITFLRSPMHDDFLMLPRHEHIVALGILLDEKGSTLSSLEHRLQMGENTSEPDNTFATEEPLLEHVSSNGARRYSKPFCGGHRAGASRPNKPGASSLMKSSMSEG